MTTHGAHPRSHGHGTAALRGRAELASTLSAEVDFIYCCNYTAVNRTKTSSCEGEQPPAHEQEDMFTPLFAGCFSLLPNLGLLRPHAAAEPVSPPRP